GAVLNAAPGATVTFGTTGTKAFLETAVITTAGIAQGLARIVSTSAQLTCTALILDSTVTPPAAMSNLVGFPASAPSGATPTRTPTGSSIVTPPRSPTVTPSGGPTATATSLSAATPTGTNTPTATPSNPSVPTASPSSTVTPGPPMCVGDCRGNNRVTLDE